MIPTDNDFVQQIPGTYEVLRFEHLNAANCDAYLLRHRKSGSTLCLFPNNDDNKLFCAAFGTPPEDDSGIPHIIEHSVLCGSDKYPVKDPFMQLVRGSMYTFLNAMTYPDKTVYPVSSCNDRDFINLSNVYLDAVFAPKLLSRREIFMQEGIRLEPSDNGGLAYGGVVYSEMQGVVSNVDSNVYDELIYSLFPDTAYGKNSGGEPEAIRELTYERLTDYYKRHYSPAAAYIFLYGKLDYAERLEYIDRNYLSRECEAVSSAEYIPQTPFGTLRRFEKTYPLPEGETADGKTYLAYGSVFCDSLDTVDCFAADYLSDILVESPGAPIKTALIEAGLGSEVYGGFINHMKQPVFSVIVKNSDAHRADEFLSIVEGELRRAAREGVNRKSLLATFERSEFKLKEGEQSSSSRGLSLSLAVMQSLMFSTDDPFAAIKYDELLAKLRELAEGDYFERLALKIADSAHRSLLILRGEAGMNERKSAELEAQLSRKREKMSEDDYTKLEEAYNAFEEYQESADTPESLRCIPTLSRLDIPRSVRELFNREDTVGTLPAVCHDVDTNGLVYLRFMFDISHVPQDKLPLLDLATAIFGKVDTAHRKYTELLDEIRLNTGGFGIACTSYRIAGTRDAVRPMLEVNLRLLPSRLERACDIAAEVLTQTNFRDTKRIKEILAEEISEKQRDIVYAGSEYASSRALAYFNAADAAEDMLDGVSSYIAQRKLYESFDACADEITSELCSLVESVINRRACTVSVAAPKTAYPSLNEAVRSFSDSLASFEPLPRAARVPLGRLNEGILTTSAVQYCAAVGNLCDAGHRVGGEYMILASMLNNDYLYPELRMKGGAYGYNCSFSTVTGNVSFTTYRDPALSQSYKVFASCGDFIREKLPTDDELNSYIVGTFGKLDRPLTAYYAAVRSLNAYMTGRTRENMLRDREAMLDTDAASLRALAQSVDDVMAQGWRCTIGNEERILEERELFDRTLRLP